MPYWCLSFEDLKSIFPGDIDYSKNSDGIRILKEEIIKQKINGHETLKKEIGEIERININAPLFFSLDNLLSELRKMNKRTLWKSDNSSTYDADTESYVPFHGWLGFDPTNNCIASDRHVRLAIG